MTYKPEDLRRRAVILDASGFDDTAAMLRAGAEIIDRLAWQTIDTAPRDGSRVLVLMNGVPRFARWDDQKHHVNPRPFWHCFELGVTVSRANQPGLWFDLPTA